MYDSSALLNSLNKVIRIRKNALFTGKVAQIWCFSLLHLHLHAFKSRDLKVWYSSPFQSENAKGPSEERW